jgi:hypothetical protein
MEETMMHHIFVREQPPGEFVAYPCGLPELAVTAGTYEVAVSQARAKFVEWVKQGKLVPVNVTVPLNELNPPPPRSPEDEQSHREFIRILAENRRQEDEREDIWKVEIGDIERRRQVIDTIQHRFENLKNTIYDYEIPWPDGENSPDEERLKEAVEKWREEVRKEVERDSQQDA